MHPWVQSILYEYLVLFSLNPADWFETLYVLLFFDIVPQF